MTAQIGLFDVLSVYDDEALTNQELYDRLCDRFNVSESALAETVVVDKTGRKASALKRRVRWHQQTLKHSQLLQRVENGSWQRTGKRSEFTQLIGRQALIAYCTDLGCALWGDIGATADAINAPIHLYFSSPPYPLTKERSYGNVSPGEYVDWLIESLRPVVGKLADGGALALNISNDIFYTGSPRRHSHLSRLTVALEDQLGLMLMDTIPWKSNKEPLPSHWAIRKKVHLYAKYEPILWVTNNPDRAFSNNERLKSDGMRGNVWEFGNKDVQNRHLTQQCQDLGLPSHDAMMPGALVRQAIKFWTEPGQLVVDLMSGTNRLGFEAEQLGRRWITGEQNAQSIAGGMLRWGSDCDEIVANKQFLKVAS